jgi:hypothetical protein
MRRNQFSAVKSTAKLTKLNQCARTLIQLYLCIYSKVAINMNLFISVLGGFILSKKSKSLYPNAQYVQFVHYCMHASSLLPPSSHAGPSM